MKIAPENRMENEYWQDRWKANDIHFHIKDVRPTLIRYFSSLPKGVVFVPLCGKSLDMYWLRSMGHTVIAVELSPLACDAFFKENNIPVKMTTEGNFIKYEAKGITLWCGDFFELPQDTFSKITTIYDRAALFALPYEIRKKYVNFIKEKTRFLSKIDMLLMTVEFDQSLKQGPPFSIDEKEVRELYSDVFFIEKLPEEDVSAFKDHPKFKNIDIKDQAYWLKKI